MYNYDGSQSFLELASLRESQLDHLVAGSGSGRLIDAFKMRDMEASLY
jgi:hypothetical protein